MRITALQWWGDEREATERDYHCTKVMKVSQVLEKYY